MDLRGITQETLDLMREPMMKAVTTTGFTTATGLQGYELEGPAKFLRPVLSPWRNRLPRTTPPIGSLQAHWKAIVDINVGNANPFVPFGTAGTVVQTSEQDYAAAYVPIALGDTVQMDAQNLARGYDDLRARSGTNLLFALMIAEDKMLLGGQNFALQTPGTPTVTFATTGGTIANATAVNFVVAVRTIENYFFGGGTVTSANGTATTGGGTTNTATASVTGVAGAVAYDWYAGASNTVYYYVGTTTAPTSPTITALPGADAATTALPELAAPRAGAGANVRTGFTDSSADANAFNGLLATCTGDINASGVQVQRGSGTSSGSYFTNLNGLTLTGTNGTVAEIDTALLSLWNSKRISPTAMLMNAQQHYDASQKMVNTGAVTTFLQGEQLDYRSGATGGVFMAKYINKAVNGQPIEMVTMPHIPPGTIILISEVLPFPNNLVTNVFDVHAQQEYQQLEYAMSRGAGATGGPRYDVEVRALETFRNMFPAGCGVIHGIANG